jgi:MFS transporter, putative metabolite:H+ symporter
MAPMSTLPLPDSEPTTTRARGEGGADALEAREMTPYLWALLVMLASATFFDGFDSAILATVAPLIQKEYGLNHSQWGLVFTIVRLGAVISFGVLVLADRYGRRLLITLTILGYALFTGLTAFSGRIESFTAYQLAARLFLASEFALALIIIGEEYPTAWRGFGIALLSGVAAVGTIISFLAAGYVLTHYSWQTMYLIGLLPLTLIFLFRLGMRETRRFEDLARERGHQSWRDQWRTMLVPFEARYRGRTLLVTLIWNCNHLVTAPAVTFWTIHAVQNHGYTPAQYGLVVAVGYLAGFALGTPIASILLNRIGRRLTCAGSYVFAAVSIFLLFAWPSSEIWAQMLLMSLTVVCFLGANAATNTYATELFPTAIRATGYSWTTNLFGRTTEILAPFLIGLLADRIGIPGAVGIMAIGPILGALIVLRYAPETRGMTLEEIEAGLAHA